MILKLALNGLKKKKRDYFILFTGLIISIAVVGRYSAKKVAG